MRMIVRRERHRLRRVLCLAVMRANRVRWWDGPGRRTHAARERGSPLLSRWGSSKRVRTTVTTMRLGHSVGTDAMSLSMCLCSRAS